MRRVLIVAVVLLAACGSDAKPAPSTVGPDEFDFVSQTEDFIEGPAVAEQVAMDFRSAVCETPFSTKVGETYRCRAEGRDGLTYEFTVEITDPDGYTIKVVKPIKG